MELELMDRTNMYEQAMADKSAIESDYQRSKRRLLDTHEQIRENNEKIVRLESQVVAAKLQHLEHMRNVAALEAQIAQAEKERTEDKSKILQLEGLATQSVQEQDKWQEDMRKKISELHEQYESKRRIDEEEFNRRQLEQSKKHEEMQKLEKEQWEQKQQRILRALASDIESLEERLLQANKMKT
mmetsp:Transcript_35525/g.57477  ORF Transcript_35525/g.57477 Transcript_35525/m.57477 type:complete len:185 (-) Transcript_35525:722-1276(-)